MGVQECERERESNRSSQCILWSPDGPLVRLFPLSSQLPPPLCVAQEADLQAPARSLRAVDHPKGNTCRIQECRPSASQCGSAVTDRTAQEPGGEGLFWPPCRCRLSQRRSTKAHQTVWPVSQRTCAIQRLLQVSGGCNQRRSTQGLHARPSLMPHNESMVVFGVFTSVLLVGCTSESVRVCVMCVCVCVWRCAHFYFWL
jgi:hypothetical protein